MSEIEMIGLNPSFIHAFIHSLVHSHQRRLSTVVRVWQLWTHWQFLSSAHKGTKPISAASKEPSGSRTANHVSRLPLAPWCPFSKYMHSSIPPFIPLSAGCRGDSGAEIVLSRAYQGLWGSVTDPSLVIAEGKKPNSNRAYPVQLKRHPSVIICLY